MHQLRREREGGMEGMSTEQAQTDLSWGSRSGTWHQVGAKNTDPLTVSLLASPRGLTKVKAWGILCEFNPTHIDQGPTSVAVVDKLSWCRCQSRRGEKECSRTSSPDPPVLRPQTSGGVKDKGELQGAP